jgi:hypothetical protein
MMDKLAEDFKKSLFNDSNEALSDYLEVGIDSFINDGILKDIPIVKTIVTVLKVGKNIHDRNLLKQTLTFINEFDKNNISDEQLKNYKERVENDSKKCEEELGRVLLLLNGFIDKEKSIMLAKLFKAYIKQLISWNEFCEYSEIVNRIFIQDLKILKDIYNKVIIDDTGSNKFRIERLYSTGLVGWNPKVMFSFGEQEITENKVNINMLGKKFVEIVF